MIERLLPTSAVGADLFADEPAALFPEEEAVIARAVDKRRREFTTVRACARRALAALGHPPAPLVPGERGAPRWPAGIVGSMTHCDGYRGCVLARATDFASIGIDAEPNLPLPDGVERLISLPRERTHLAELAGRSPAVCWDRLLFCAKESVYKAWSPIVGTWLDFEAAQVEISADGSFAARILIPAPVTGFTGHWLCDRGYIVTVILNDATTPAA
jgi:4'-phosphopantetheinyl transferase EntD